MTGKILQAKQKHHYVWRHYLSRWSPDNDQRIWHTTFGGKIIHASTRGLAMQKNFYQISELTAKEITIIKAFLKPLSEDLQDVYLSLLNEILKIQDNHSLYSWGGEYDEEAKELFYAIRCNFLEDIYGSHESNIIPIIAALANGELNILDDTKNMCSFMAFLGFQMLRTKKIKDTVLRLQPREANLENVVADAMPNIWWFVSYMLGGNLGKSLYMGRHQDTHSLLVNNTDIPFITSDQPVINVHECANDSGMRPPEQMDIYYPIAPQIAYFIGDAGRFRSGKVTITEKEIISEFNIKMAKKSNNSIFGNSELILDKYIKYTICGR